MIVDRWIYRLQVPASAVFLTCVCFCGTVQADWFSWFPSHSSKSADVEETVSRLPAPENQAIAKIPTDVSVAVASRKSGFLSRFIRPVAAAEPVAEVPTPSIDRTVTENLQRQIDIQQQQLLNLREMLETSSQEIQRQSTAAATIPEALEDDLAELQARQRLAAVRDTEIANQLDTIAERFDANQRATALPSTAREWFLPSRFNESPIVHYGQFAFTFADFEDKNSNFGSPVYFPRFLMMLNEQLVLDINPLIKSDGIEIIAAEVDWHLHDNLSLIFGRFYSPFGFFGERLQTGWVWKSIDIPLMFNQVHPTPSSMNGVMARGSFYPSIAPVKFEYSAFIANGISLELEEGDEKDFADLKASRKVFDDVNNEKAIGGRVGLSFPERGVIIGMSGMSNGAYDAAAQEDLSMYGVDVSYHRGNWDLRYEYISVDQQWKRPKNC